MLPISRTARTAGVLYLVNGVTGFFGILYVPGALVVPGNAAATANNILSSQMLFRLGMLSELVCAVTFIFLVRTLARLLGEVSKSQASLMVTFGLVSVPIMFVNVLNDIAALILLRGSDYFAAFHRQQLEALAMFFVRLHGQGFVVSEVFWGLWLLPFGVLVTKSGFLPRFMGILLIVACFGYLADALAWLLVPQYGPAVERVAGILEGAGELPIMLWLLIWGAKVRSSAAATA